MAREVIKREELEALIKEGKTAQELKKLIIDRLAYLDALILGTQSVQSETIPVKLATKHRVKHIYIIGKSGGGKTTLMNNQIAQDLSHGYGMAAIGPEEELFTDELLPIIPEHRIKDVVYVNPADTDRPIPFNPLHLDDGEDLDLKVDETYTILNRLFEQDRLGSRGQTILRQALYTLVPIPQSTLLDVEKLLDPRDASYREWAVTQIDDESARQFWLYTYPQYPRDAHLPIINRLGKFLRPKVVRTMICAPDSFNIRHAMDEGKILLFNFSDGILGEANSMVLGALVIAKIQMAAMSRANISKHDRKPFYVYIDEFQAFCGVASASYEKMLSRARKYGLGLILAHQQIGQIKSHLVAEILGNVSTIISFFVRAADAKTIAKEMVGEVDGELVELQPKQLLSLRTGETFCKIDRSVFYMKTLPPVSGNPAIRDRVIAQSRQTYGCSAKPVLTLSNKHEVENTKPGVIFDDPN
jgi:hypothetical protein